MVESGDTVTPSVALNLVKRGVYVSIPHHPSIGTIVICDFAGKIPEMASRHPAVIVSPQLPGRNMLCAVVPLSTTEPDIIKPYHYKLHFSPLLPHPYTNDFSWVKADLITTVSLERLHLLRRGKSMGTRKYDIRVISAHDLKEIQKCVLHALQLSCLTGHL